MRKLASLICGILALFPAIAGAQVNLPNLPPNTVVGRQAIPTQGGPAQAIPFQTLVNSLLNSFPPCNANTVFAGPSSGSPAAPSCRTLVSADIPSATIPTVSFQTRALAIAATIASNVNAIAITGYTTANDGGGGTYNKLASPPSPIKAWHFQSADGAWWQLTTSGVVPRQVGAACNGTTDDSIPAQAWVDYSSTFGVQSLGQPCNLNVPTATINLASNTNIQGRKQLTITRSTDVVAQLLQATNASKVSVRGLTIVCSCGFSSTTSNSIVTGTQTFTVPAGLTLSTTAPNNNIQIMATSAPVNYLIAQITGYTPIGGGQATLTINTVSGNAVGSGTYSAWTLASYPVNGDIAPVPAGLSFVGCTDSIQEDNIVSGPFYDAIDNRNGNRETVNANYVTGWVNRGIHEAAYLSFFSNDIHITNNTLIGGTVSEYGINTSGTDSAQISQLMISGNSVRGVVGQGINTSGQVIYVSTVNNTVVLSTLGATTAVGFLIESVPGSIPQHVTVSGNTVTGGANGILILGAFYVNVSDNNIAGTVNGVTIQGTGSAGGTLYATITGNIASGGSGNGYNILGGVAGGIVGVSFSNNHAIAFTGWGFFVSSTTNIAFGGGNQSIGNTAGAYSVNGTTTTPAASNL